MPADIAATALRVKASIQKVIVGRDEAVDLLLVALLADGHALVEDVPGVGKTSMARALAKSLGCSFHRVQCTPDLLPSDLTGTHVYNQAKGEFTFRPGPLVAQIVLVDEINRATPRTQSALLEAMEERQLTVEGEVTPLPRPFLVIATQNPVELEGTFPLPEAQLDRFLLRLRLGYPTEKEDHAILSRFRADSPMEALTPVIDTDELLAVQRAVRDVAVNADLEAYLVSLVRATREHAAVELGASPRAMLGLYRASQAFAALRGRAYVLPDDIKAVAPSVLEHRLMLRSGQRLRGQTVKSVTEELLSKVAVPVEPSTR